MITIVLTFKEKQNGYTSGETDRSPGESVFVFFLFKERL